MSLESAVDEMNATPSPDAEPPPRRRGPLLAAIAILACTALWQVDLVRQNARILWDTVTGQVWKVRGHIEARDVVSSAVHQTRTVYVYTPPGYDIPVNLTRRYRVLYLLHGAPGLPSDWIRYGEAPAVVERLTVSRQATPMIIVCPDGRGIGALGDSEYIDAPGQPAARRGVRVASFILHDLVPWVDSHYRTQANPAGRILAGDSTGGYGAVNLTLQHPDLFGAAFSFSGYFTAEQYGWARPVWGHHPPAALLARESPEEYVDAPRPAWSRLYIYVGEGLDEHPPYPRESAAFSERLTLAHIAFTHQRMRGKHSWDLWRDLLRDAIVDYERRLQPTRQPQPGAIQVRH
ncbi:MAG: alpha/beta hydrolase [Capsulimonadaceae bacterium]